MKNFDKYKKYFDPEIGKSASLCNADWQKYLKNKAEARAATKEAKTLAKEAKTLAKEAKTLAKEAKTLAKTSKTIKLIPGVATVAAGLGFGADVYAKGPIYGPFNSGVDAIPLAGQAKVAVELMTGKDFVPDDAFNGKPSSWNPYGWKLQFGWPW